MKPEELKKYPWPRGKVACCDMQSFYASCEAVAHGLDPANDYVAVVGDKNRPGSVVLAASKPMKEKYSIKTGSRLYEIPNHKEIHVFQARMKYYLDISMAITRMLHNYAPPEAIHVYSIDEVFITLDGLERLFGEPLVVTKEIQSRILNEFGIRAKIGIGENKLQSKIALDILAKKSESGIATVTYEDFAEKLWGTPIGDVWGVGSRMKNHLNRMGIMTLGSLAKYPIELLRKRWGVMGEQLWYHAHGIDLSPTLFDPEANDVQKGFSQGITLLRDYDKESEVKTVILELVEECCRKARKAKKAGRTISLGIGYSHDLGGGGFGRSITLDTPTNITQDVYQACLKLFNRNYDGSVVRNVHVSLTKLTDEYVYQLDLFDDKSKQKDLAKAMDSIRERFGSTAILRAASFTKGGTMVERSAMIGGHRA